MIYQNYILPVFFLLITTTEADSFVKKKPTLKGIRFSKLGPHFFLRFLF